MAGNKVGLLAAFIGSFVSIVLALLALLGRPYSHSAATYLFGVTLAFVVCNFLIWNSRILQVCSGTLRPLALCAFFWLACVFGLLVDINILSYNSGWCCNRTWDDRELCDLTNRVGELLEQHGVPHFLCRASLLGAVRHGGNIPWQTHSDICLLSDVMQVSSLLRSAGHEVVTAETELARVVSPLKRWYDLGDAWVDLYDIDKIFRRRGLFKESKRYANLTDGRYCGRRWNVPEDSVENLVVQYDNWAMPMLPPGSTVRGWTCARWMDGCSMQNPKTSEPSIGQVVGLVLLTAALGGLLMIIAAGGRLRSFASLSQSYNQVAPDGDAYGSDDDFHTRPPRTMIGRNTYA